MVASSRFVVGSAVTVTEDRPANEEAVPPKEIDVDPIVTDELVSDEFPMFDRVLLAPLIDTPLSVESVPPRFSVSEPIVTELLTRLLLPMLDSVFADPLMETPFSVDSVPPRLTVSVPIVMELLVRLEFAMLLKVLLEPLIVLLVSVSVVSRPTSVSVLVGSVRVPVLTIVAMTGAVSVLFVNVWAPVSVTTVESMLIVFAVEPSNVVPESNCNPVLTVSAAVVVAVIVPDPPRATVIPLYVTDELVRLAFAIFERVLLDPEIVLLVSVSAPASVARVPEVGRVTLVAPVAVRAIEYAPEVVNSPAVLTLPPKVM